MGFILNSNQISYTHPYELNARPKLQGKTAANISADHTHPDHKLFRLAMSIRTNSTLSYSLLET